MADRIIEYPIEYTGQEVDDAITKSKQVDLSLNGLIRIITTADAPVDLDTMKTPGNYTANYFTHAPSQAANIMPINFSVVKFTDSGEYGQYAQVFNEVIFRVSTNGIFSDVWDSVNGEDHVYQDDSEPTNPYVSMLWYDKVTTSLKVYDGTKFVTVGSSTYMSSAVYDPTNKAVDVYQYLKGRMQDYYARPNYDTWTTALINAFSAADVTSSTSVIDLAAFYNNANAKNSLYLNTNTPAKLYRTEISDSAQSWIPQTGSLTSPTILSSVYDEDRSTILLVCNETTSPTKISIAKIVEFPASTMVLSDIMDNTDISLTFTSNVNGVIQKYLNYSKDSAGSTVKLLIPCHDSNGYGVFIFICTLISGNQIGNIVADRYVKVGTTEFKYKCLNNRFYAIPYTVSSNSTIYWSDDGIIWSASVLPRASKWIDIDYGNGIYVLTSDNATVITGKHPFVTSIDGLSWTEVSVSTIDTTFVSSIRFTKFRNESFYFGSKSGCFYVLSYTGLVSKVIFSSDTTKVCDSIGFLNSKFYVLYHTENGDGTTYSVIYSTFTDFKQKLVDHIENPDIHVDAALKADWSARATQSQMNDKVAVVQSDVETYAESQVSTIQSSANTLGTEVTYANNALSTHIGTQSIHTTQAEQDDWTSKAAGGHTHLLDDRVTIDSAAVVSGVFALAQIPVGALERQVPVTSNAQRLALTIDDVQNGDTVVVKIGNANTFYFVIDDTKLGTEEAFQIYSAGTAVDVDFSIVANKPTTVPGYGITDAYTKTQIDSTVIPAALTTAETYTDQVVNNLLTMANAILILSE